MKTKVKKLAHKALKGGLYDTAVLPKHFGTAVAANVKHGFPAKNLQVIGVTGTNGKTSTCFLIHRMLVEAGYNAGLMTTVAYGVNDDITPQIAHMTSQPINLLLSRINKMKQQGMNILVLEVTSHALAHRTLGVPIDIAVMTNITHEHLDYHRTFERYRGAKLKLFKLAARNKKGHQIGIINDDDPSADIFADAVPHSLRYSLKPSTKPGHAGARKLNLTPDGSQFEMVIDDTVYNLKCNLPGSFNVSNTMAAALVGHALKIDKTKIEKGIAALQAVEGRMTRIDEGQDFTVIVDFAHTPDSFEKLFADIKPMVKGRLISLFGSAGRRDVSKRAIQGRIAGQYSDLVIVTEEDDRDVSGQLIMDQIAEGAVESGLVKGKSVLQILDRREAIKAAFSAAKPGDTVLLLGKGHEKTIERADGEIDWNEPVIASELLKQLVKSR